MSTNFSYTRTARFLHWLMAALFIFVWCIGFYGANFLSTTMDGSLKGDFITLHKNIASSIFFLVLIRIFWRYTHPVPVFPEHWSKKQKKYAKFGHFLLYFLLLLMPISGFLFSWSAGRAVPVLYLFNMPPFFSVQPQFLAIMKMVHIYLSWFVGLVALGHILMALKHHFIDKDKILLRMLKD